MSGAEGNTGMNRENSRTWRIFADGVFYFVGSVLYAISIVVFIAPNNISPGGLTGVATQINYLIPVPIGTAILFMNIPLMLAAWKQIGLDFTIRTSICIVISSAMIDLLEFYIPPFHGDIILTVVFGGVLSGAGLGLIYMRGGTTGGTELIARLVGSKFQHVPIGRLILLVDAIVVASSALVYRNFQSALYAIIYIYVSTALMDTLIYGKNKGKMLLIVTKAERQAAAAIMQRIQRGVTILKGAGAYTGMERQILLCAVRPSEVYLLRTLVYDIDPSAFVVVLSTDEVLGEGFRPFNKI